MAYWKATSSLQDETKQLLRSIIESAPYRIYTRDVEREFSKLMGYELPFRKLGYATCEEYLQSIPDTLSISPTASGPLVRSIAISETKHIGRLVMTQKNNPGRCRQPRKGCAIEYPQLTIGNLRQQQPTKALTDCSESQPVVRRPPLPPNPYCGAHIRGSFTYGSARNDYKTYSNLQGLSIPASAQYAAHNQNVYSIIKTNIVQLLMFYPKGLKIEDFNTSFQSMFNMPLCPNRFGYQTVVEMLVDMPDVVVLRNTGRCLLAFLKQMPTPYYNYQVMPPPLCSANWGYPKPRVPAPQKLERNSQVDQPIQPVTTNNDTTKSQFVQNLEDCKKVIDEQKTCRDISQHSSRSSPNHDHSDVSKGNIMILRC